MPNDDQEWAAAVLVGSLLNGVPKKTDNVPGAPNKSVDFLLTVDERAVALEVTSTAVAEVIRQQEAILRRD